MSLLKDLATRFNMPLVETTVVASVAFAKQCTRCRVQGASQLTVFEERPTRLGKKLGIRPRRYTVEGLLSGGCGNMIFGCPDRKSHTTKG